ncbi:MAG: hypothetical protein HXY40_12500 [Chloroflexi bacterium]|nr:hypothetical protein [Chloroflexota bacterium]
MNSQPVLSQKRLGVALRLAGGLAGLACLTLGQGLLLDSRLPFAPLLLYAVGTALLLPLLNHGAKYPARESHEGGLIEFLPARDRGLYAAGALFFGVIGGLAAQLGRPSLLLVAMWLLCTLATLALFVRVRLHVSEKALGRFWPEALALAALPFVLALLLRATYAPEIGLVEHYARAEAIAALQSGQTPAQYPASPFLLTLETMAAGRTLEMADFVRVSAAAALALVALVSMLGAALAGRWAGLAGAALAASSGWTLALAKAGTEHALLALCAALYLLALWAADGAERRKTYSTGLWALVGVCLGQGWLISPDFGWLALLLPARAALHLLDERPLWWKNALQTLRRLYGWRGMQRALVWFATPLLLPAVLLDAWRRAQRGLPGMVVAALLALIVLLPFVLLAPDFGWLPQAHVATDYEARSGQPPLYASLDSLASSALLFYLTRDPSPLHGLLNRPALLPLVTALLTAGLLLWALRWTQRDTRGDGDQQAARVEKGRTLLPLLALAMCLLPGALRLEVPASAPDVLAAGLALPLVFVLVGMGAAALAGHLRALLGRLGMLLALLLLAGGVLWSALDAQRHYNDVALPAYEQSAQVYEQTLP